MPIALETALPSITAGVVTTSDTSDIVFAADGDMPQFRNPYDVLLDNRIYHYHFYHEDGVQSGYEWGWGDYDFASKTLTRNVLESSAGGAKVNWGNSDNKIVVISTSPDFFYQFGRLWAELEPWHGLCVAGTGNSQNHNVSLLQGAPLTTADFDGIEDWCKIAAGTGSNAWRTIDPDDEYAAQPDGNAVRFTGYPRSQSYDGGTTWFQTAQTTMEVAKIARVASGRRVWTIHHSATATAFRDATHGWMYADSGNCGNDFADRITDAIAAIDARATTLGLPPQGITVPHIVVMQHGASDAGSTPEGQYAMDILDWVYNMEQDQFWGVCDKDISRYLILEPGLVYDESTHWNGFGLLAENAPERVQVFSAFDIEPYDIFGHGTGESIIAQTKTVMENLISPSPYQRAKVGIQTKPNYKTAANMFYDWDGALPLPSNYWDDDGDKTGAPADSHFCVDTTNNKFRLDKHSKLALFFTTTPDSGDWKTTQNGYVGRAVERIGRDGANFIWRFGDGTNNRTIITSGLATDQGGYWEWDLVNEVDQGSPAATNLELFVGRGLFDGEDFIAHFPAPIIGEAPYGHGTSVSFNNAQRTQFHRAMFDGDGKLFRPSDLLYWTEPLAQTTEISNTTATTTLCQVAASDNTRVAMRFEVMAKRTDDSSTNMYQATVVANGYTLTSTPVISGTPSIDEHGSDYSGLITLTLDGNAAGADTYRLRAALTNNDEVWVFTVIAKHMTMPDA